MSLLKRLLLITFIESFACILVERGIYFFGTYRLQFTDRDNLCLALAFGLAYVAGAMCSHRLSVRATEKWLLAATLIGQTVLHAYLATASTTAAVFLASTLIGGLNGLKWPVIESYVSAGQTPSGAARAVGLFNISWSVAVPPSIAVVGPLMTLHPSSFFVLAGAMNLVSLALLRPLTSRPVHLPHDHPQRPSPESLRKLGGMLGFSRWTMFFSYAALFAMAALMPPIFKRFALPSSIATPLSGVVDFMRLAAFIVLQRTARWHYRWTPLVAALAAAPVGLVLVVSGMSVAAVLAGEVIFGLASGMIYYAALYYAMVVQNASVEAGGTHESLIGLGFAVGPLACLAGTFLAPWFGGQQALAMLAGITPLFLLCTAGAVARAHRFSQGEPAAGNG